MQGRLDNGRPRMTVPSLYAMLRMHLDGNPDPHRCALFVEGANDHRSFLKLATRSCRVIPCDGKSAVIETMGYTVMRGGGSRVVGVVDRDFDHLVGFVEPANKRVAWLSLHGNDLEAVVMRTRGKELVEQLGLEFQSCFDPWLQAPATGSSLDMLVQRVAVPMGMLRTALALAAKELRVARPGKFTNPPTLGSDLLDAIWKVASPTHTPTVAELEKCIPQTVHDPLRNMTVSNLEALPIPEDPWALVRGKDLVGALAKALHTQRKPPVEQEASAADIEHRINRLIVDHFDEVVAEKAGVYDSIARGSAGDAETYQYLKRRTG